MQEIHPADLDMKMALIPVILAVVFLWFSVDYGVWEKFLVKVEWLIHGVMGLWGE